MKKFLIAAITVVILLTVAGCSLFQKKENIPVDDAALEKEVGLITTREEQAILQAPTKFILITDSGSRIFIDSVNVNLRKYAKRRVEVEGSFNVNKSIFNIETITSLGHETQVKQAYQNGELGLKFSYPSVWALSEERDVANNIRIVITPYEVTPEELLTVDNIAIDRSENNRRQNAREWLDLDELYRPKDTSDTNVYQQAFTGLAQLDAVKKSSADGKKIEFFVNRDAFIYHFSYIAVNDTDSDISKNVFFEIVSVFEFIPFSETTGTTTPSSGTSSSAATLNTATSTAPAVQPQSNIAPRASQPETSAPVPSAPQSNVQTGTTSANQELTTIRQSFINYIRDNITTLAPETSSDANGWRVTRYEFAFPENHPENFNDIYVTYADSTDARKILLRVSDRTKPDSVQRVAYFKPGETTDWQLQEGADFARGSERTVIVTSSSTSSNAPEITVRSGMRLLEARSFNVKIQYPTNWYWAYSSGGYSFSAQPVTAENVSVRFTKNPSDLPSSMTVAGDINGRQLTSGEMAESLTMCLQIQNDKYCLTGEPSLRDTMRQMIETVQD